MRILGIDPGTWRTGVGLIETAGNRYQILHCEVISIREALPLPQRLHMIHERLGKILAQYRPDALALESIFYRKNVQSMLKIGEARACVMLAATDHGIHVLEYPPALVKQSVSGNGRASKGQVQAMVKRLLNLHDEPPQDAADALAVAICHANHYQHQNLVAQTGKARVNLQDLLRQQKKQPSISKNKGRYVSLSYGTAG